MSASRTQPGKDLLSRFNLQEHPVFTGNFDSREQEEMLEDDFNAGVGVCMLLAVVVLMGLLIMIAAVLLTM